MAQETDADYEAHRRTWRGFVRLTVYSTVGVLAILVLLTYFFLT